MASSVDAAGAGSVETVTASHPHARMVLQAGLAGGSPSHAYLFHGVAGTGKRTAARTFAAELIAAASADAEAARRRVLGAPHPDVTWAQPTGAHVMRVDDIEGPVVSAATRTPFEARRRVFVLERVDTMNDEVANRLLKTLEEPPSFVHLILVTDALGQVLETVVSRCQLVRFDPLAAAQIAGTLESEGAPPDEALACARLGLGSATRARYLASDEGRGLRGDVERLVTHALSGEPPAADEPEPWRPLLARAEQRRAAAESDVAAQQESRLEIEPKGRERRALEREFDEAARRDGRRARTQVLDLGLELAALAFRDLLCLVEGAHDAILATDRIGALTEAARDRDARALRRAVERCEETRSSFEVNVSEELALTALTIRLRRLLGEAT